MKDFLKNLKLSEDTVGTILGGAILVVTGFVLFNYITSINKTEKTGDTLSTTTTKEETVAKEAAPGATYTVQKGDSLWGISEKAYGTGYAWQKVYEANKDVIGKNASAINTGTKLTLPNTTEATPEHAVARGETLWNIAVNYCGNGFVWSNIAKANSITIPTALEIGTKLRVICK